MVRFPLVRLSVVSCSFLTSTKLLPAPHKPVSFMLHGS